MNGCSIKAYTIILENKQWSASDIAAAKLRLMKKSKEKPPKDKGE
jgi:hypothetical protein